MPAENTKKRTADDIALEAAELDLMMKKIEFFRMGIDLSKQALGELLPVGVKALALARIEIQETVDNNRRDGIKADLLLAKEVGAELTPDQIRFVMYGSDLPSPKANEGKVQKRVIDETVKSIKEYDGITNQTSQTTEYFGLDEDAIIAELTKKAAANLTAMAAENPMEGKAVKHS